MELDDSAYKTPAEFKAFRLNKAAQSRLNTEKDFISKQERNFSKDFKTSRIKVESQFMRRLSLQDCAVTPAPAGALQDCGLGAPGSASLGPHSSGRRLSTSSRLESLTLSTTPTTPFTSPSTGLTPTVLHGRRTSLCSFRPNSAGPRARNQRKRRMSYGGLGTVPLPGPDSLADGGRISASSPDGCEFCAELSELLLVPSVPDNSGPEVRGGGAGGGSPTSKRDQQQRPDSGAAPEPNARPGRGAFSHPLRQHRHRHDERSLQPEGPGQQEAVRPSPKGGLQPPPVQEGSASAADSEPRSSGRNTAASAAATTAAGESAPAETVHEEETATSNSSVLHGSNSGNSKNNNNTTEKRCTKTDAAVQQTSVLESDCGQTRIKRSSHAVRVRPRPSSSSSSLSAHVAPRMRSSRHGGDTGRDVNVTEASPSASEPARRRRPRAAAEKVERAHRHTQFPAADPSGPSWSRSHSLAGGVRRRFSGAAASLTASREGGSPPAPATTTATTTTPKVTFLDGGIQTRQARREPSHGFSSGDFHPETLAIIAEHAKECPAGEAASLRRNSAVLDTVREKSPRVVPARKTSEIASPGGRDRQIPRLQRRVVQFLEKQEDFNKRFPLRDHEVRSLECSRPDLLNASKTARNRQKQVSKEKARMIAEVLEKLGGTEYCDNHYYC